jgi:hypothetical protein
MLGHRRRLQVTLEQAEHGSALAIGYKRLAVWLQMCDGRRQFLFAKIVLTAPLGYNPKLNAASHIQGIRTYQ